MEGTQMSSRHLHGDTGVSQFHGLTAARLIPDPADTPGMMACGRSDWASVRLVAVHPVLVLNPWATASSFVHTEGFTAPCVTGRAAVNMKPSQISPPRIHGESPNVITFSQPGREGLLLLSWLHVRGHVHPPRAA